MRRKKSKKFSGIITKEEKAILVKEIQIFFNEERGEDIGTLASEVLLDFFIEKIGPTIYNNSLDDARRWFSEKMDNLDSDFDLLYNK
ncbi:DUF2164 domain-containing protein [Helicovermis profundi]|uniref:DUF2164 domain-containing protein n=1 Tax=Helicovermis profundi TaxID=3065157 RepID=A0AAU9E9V4_9FIRM|nr:hypothetical protein HLPR_18880 [Clostridia bacterium S502]